MPTYEYACTVCGQHIEVFQRFSEDALDDLRGLRGQAPQGLPPGRHRLQGLGVLRDGQPLEGLVRRLARRTRTRGVDVRRVRTRTRAPRAPRAVRAPRAATGGPLRRARTAVRPRRAAVRRNPRLRDRGADRRVRRLGVLLAPGRRRDRRGRHPLRRALGPAGGRLDRALPGRVHPPARREAPVPAARDQLPRQPVGDEGARRAADRRAVRGGIAADGRQDRRLRGLRPDRRPDAVALAHVLRRAGDDPHLLRRPVLRDDAAGDRGPGARARASACTTAGRWS